MAIPTPITETIPPEAMEARAGEGGDDARLEVAPTSKRQSA
jgi:hypothetical protein